LGSAVDFEDCSVACNFFQLDERLVSSIGAIMLSPRAHSGKDVVL
jgi:hypothetical protein